MANNLPPGCTSPDGGIDHDYEAACETLCDAIQNGDEARMLLEALPTLRAIAAKAFHLGREESKYDAMYDSAD